MQDGEDVCVPISSSDTRGRPGTRVRQRRDDRKHANLVFLKGGLCGWGSFRHGGVMKEGWAEAGVF